MKVIVNADDFGRSHERNVAIEWAFEEGLISQASLMVNAPYSDEAIEIIKRNNYLDKVCLHINLSYGTPLTVKIKKTSVYCKDGKFVDATFLKRNLHFRFASLYKEIDAQFAKYLEMGGQMRHVDSHLFYHLDIPVLLVLIPLMRKYKFRTVRHAGTHLINSCSFKKRLYYGLIDRLYRLFFKSIKWISNIDYFLVEKPVVASDDIIELYCHPDLFPFDTTGYYDNSYSIFGNPFQRLGDHIKRIGKFQAITYTQV